MGDEPARRHRWAPALAVLLVLGAHVVALREVLPRFGPPTAALLAAVVVAKHFGLLAIIRRWWRRGARRG